MSEKIPATVPPRDWVATSISLLALVASIVIGYFSVLRVVDDVRLVLMRFVDVQIISDKQFSISKDFEVAIVNAGNRPAILRAVGLQLDQTMKGTQCGEDALSFYASTDPVVIKPGEIRAVPLHLSDPDSKEVKEVDERWLIPVRNPLEEEEFFHLRSCLVAQVTTPTKSYDNIEVAVLDQVGRIDRKAPLYNAEPDLTPRVLVHESGFSFSN